VLSKAWGDGGVGILKASGSRSLEDSIRSTLLTPTIRMLGTTVRSDRTFFERRPRNQVRDEVSQNSQSRRGSQCALQVLDPPLPGWICEDALTIPVLLPSVYLGSDFRFVLIPSAFCCGMTVLKRFTNTGPPRRKPLIFPAGDPAKVCLFPSSHPLVSL